MKKFNCHILQKNCILPVILIVAVLNIIVSSEGAPEKPPAFFLKIAKTIPRIGRSDQYEDVLLKNLDKANDDPWYKSTNPMYEISKRKIEYAPEESNTESWQYFPLAIEGPPELWRSLAGYTHDPLYSSTNDFNNGLWSRDKRTNSPHVQL